VGTSVDASHDGVRAAPSPSLSLSLSTTPLSALPLQERYGKSKSDWIDFYLYAADTHLGPRVYMV
jgi:hypothetical protein